MAESLVAVRLRSLVHKEPWEEHASEHKKVHGERTKQGNFGQVWRARRTDPDGPQTIVVIKEVTRTAAESAWQEDHELECLRRLSLVSGSCHQVAPHPPQGKLSRCDQSHRHGEWDYHAAPHSAQS